MVMASLVIKVKYEETLRRFNVAVNGDQRLELNMEGLRLKICSLFNLPPDAGFRLTYVDEDDDVVTLVDDEDLHDMVRQGLDPVRITVVLNSDKSSQTYAASESSTSSRPSAQNLQSNISKNVAEVLSSVQKVNPDVAEFLKSVQEPLGHALSKLSLEMSSKAVSASPVLADLFDGLSKIGQSYQNASHSHSDTNNISIHSDSSDDPMINSVDRKPEASVDEGTKHDRNHTSGPAKPTPKSTQAARGKSPIRPKYFPSKIGMTKDKEVMEDSAEKNVGAGANKDLKPQVTRDYEKESSKNEAPGTRGFQNGGNARSPYYYYFNPVPGMECPFSGVPVSSSNNSYSSNSSFSRATGISPNFHKGVCCDGCGVLPIAGPRYKSKVRYDYDLCSLCFLRMGNGADYTRIDIPLSSRHSLGVVTPPVPVPYMMKQNAKKLLRSRLDSRFIMDVNVMDGTTMAPSTPFTKIWRMRNNGTLPWHRGLRLLWIGGDRFSRSDSVEIEVPVNGVNIGGELDVAVDFIAPELPGRYISYWRMAEPSGHKFGQRVWVLVQVDTSVDLTRESSPVLNLNLPPECIDGSDVNAEPALDIEAGDSSAPSTVEQHRQMKTEMEDFPINDDLLVATDVVYPSPAVASPSIPAAAPDDKPVSTVTSSVSFPDANANATAYQKPAASAPLASYPKNAYQNPAASAPLASYPIIFGESSAAASNVAYDKSKLHKPTASPPLSSYPTIFPEYTATIPNVIEDQTKPNDSNPEQVSEKSEVEENLLKELEIMGFRQIDLNKEVLRNNEYNLERSVDDLCGVSEWDPILEELQEMGFHDKETNKKLLAKNNGSLTRVVMDLIAEEQAQ